MTRELNALGAIALVAATVAIGACDSEDEPQSGAIAPGPRIEAEEGDAGNQRRPNVVVVMTDDQDAESMKVMSTVEAEIADHGVTFADSFASWPLCCPSRATFLTGQYSRNHGVRGPNAEEGFPLFDDEETLPVWLRRSGYRTVHVGKYLNGYGVDDPEYIPPGWDEWYATTDTTDQWLYDYTLNENGELVDYGSEPGDFKQDVLTDRAIEVIERTAVSAAPLFLTVNYTAPHVAQPGPEPPDDCAGGAKPAPRHASSYDDTPLPTPPSFNEEDVSDKPEEIRETPELPAELVEQTESRYRCYLESLLSVDQGVGGIVDALRAHGELGKTLLIFTSDNGFLHGQHRTPFPKSYVYEGSIRVPLLVRGPGIPEGAVVRDLAVNADLAPTIVELTGAEAGLRIDGQSLLAAARQPKRETDRALLLDTHNASGVRTTRYVYAEYDTGERELYDLRRDPHELESVDGDPAYARIQSALADLLDQLRRCAGSECQLSAGL